MHSMLFSGVGYAWPGENPLFENISFSLGRGIYAIAGPNGSGKSTLLRLAAGELSPLEGSIRTGIVPHYLGNTDALTGQRSSGEQQMLLLSQALARCGGLLLLDEPERHLDGENRRNLVRRLERFGGTILLVTHEAELLDLADAILHLEAGSLSFYRMPFASYWAKRTAHKEAQLHAQVKAEQQLQKDIADSHRQLERQLKRERNAARRAPDAGIPRVALGLMKRNAQKTRGKIMRHTRDKISAAEEVLAERRKETGTKPDFSFAGFHNMHCLASVEIAGLNFALARKSTLWAAPVSLRAIAAERVRVLGRNGSGKTMLLKAISGEFLLARTGMIRVRARRTLLLNHNWQSHNPEQNIIGLALENFSATDEGLVRRLLGAYGYTGNTVFRRLSAISTGERARLLVLLLSKTKTPPDILLLDEAETGLDRETRLLFAQFLAEYRGLLFFATHSEEFAALIKPTGTISLVQ